MGKSVCRGTSNGERERKRAHGAQTRRREEREKSAQISVSLSWFSHTGCAQQICVPEGDIQKTNLDAFMEIRAT